MKNFFAFTRKEFLEGIRTYKAIIFLVVFMMFGFMNPLMAKLIPEIMAGMVTDGMTITLADPTALDSWLQFFKNVSQMGLIVAVILFSGILTNEVSKGTLINMLTKGLSRTSVVLAKFTYLFVVWTIAYVICFGVTAGYTVYLFPDSSVENLMFAAVALWVFGVMLLALLVGASSFARSSYVCLLVVGCAVACMMIAGIAPAVHDFNPMSLLSDSTGLLTGTAEVESLMPAIGVAAAISVSSLVAAVLIFRRRQL